MHPLSKRLLLSVLCCLALVGGCKEKGERKSLSTSPLVVRQKAEVERTLLYPSLDDMLLTGTTVMLPEGKTREESMTQVVKRYLSGPAGDGQMLPFPVNCRLRALYLLGNSEVVLDLSGPVNEGGGSDTELARVYGLIDTLAWNFNEVESVRILVNGSGVDTLLGHLDLRRPLPPEPGLLSKDLRRRWGENTDANR